MTLSEYEEKTKQLIDFMDEMGKRLKKISEDLDKKPREWWVVVDDGVQFMIKECELGKFASRTDLEIIHVKEVIE